MITHAAPTSGETPTVPTPTAPAHGDAIAPVLIVGAGPTGLALAAELARFGMPFRLIDRAPAPAQWSRALVVQARTLEQFEHYGIAEAAVAKGRRIYGAEMWNGGRQIMHAKLRDIPSRYPFVLVLPQDQTEHLLLEYLASIGTHVERATELLDLSQDASHAVATLRHADGSTERVQASWVVGCDGAHSGVRHAAQIPFEGKPIPATFFLGDMDVSGTNVPGDDLRIYLRDGNVVFFGRLNDTSCRVIVSLRQTQTTDEPPPLALADFQAAVDMCAGPGLQLSNPAWMTRFRINQRKAQRYRAGRVLLAGDAAHIHSPVGGQGMNTGIQDAVNLAWKLAALAAGAPPALLDSYNAERGAVGKALLAFTERGLTTALSTNKLMIWLRDHMLGLVTRLPMVQRRAGGFVSETALNYRGSAIVRDCGGAGPLRAGDRAPDAGFVAADGREQRLFQRLTQPEHLLLLIDGDARDVPPAWPSEQVLALDSRTNPAIAKAYGHRGKTVWYAIRPDGYIGFRGGPENADALAAYAASVGVQRQAIAAR